MTCAICGKTTWLMFTMAAPIKGARGGQGETAVLCHVCWKKGK